MADDDVPDGRTLDAIGVVTHRTSDPCRFTRPSWTHAVDGGGGFDSAVGVERQ